MRVCQSSRITKQGFRLKSSLPVSLYVYIAEDDGSSAMQFLILPVYMLGSQYPLLAAAPLPQSTFTGIAVASQDGTVIANYNTQLSINKLDVYITTYGGGYKNSMVVGNVPFAFIGTTAAQSTIMLLPTSIKSTLPLISPDLRSLPFNAQITAFESGTKVSVNGGNSVDAVVIASNSDPLIVPSGNGAAISVNATKSVQVYKVTPSYEYAYFPEYFLSTTVQFYIIDSFSYPANVTIIVPLQSVGNILLDDQVIPAMQYRRISSNSTYYYYSQRMRRDFGSNPPNRLHTISTKSSEDRYMADVFYRDAYQKFPVALNLPG
jgi:hypothetical protein